jgi:hypothetical protein
MEDFYLHMFSNSSSDLYPDNTLTRFKCDLSNPIYLGDNNRFSVSAKKISIPNQEILNVERQNNDVIVLNDFDLSKIYGENTNPTFDFFIDFVLHFAAVDVLLYDENYFEKYLNKKIVFTSQSSIKSKEFVDDFGPFYAPIQSHSTYFPLEIHKLLLPGENQDQFVHKNASIEATAYLQNSTVRLFHHVSYTLKQILACCIMNILTSLSQTNYNIGNFRELSGIELDSQRKLSTAENFRDEAIEIFKGRERNINQLIHRYGNILIDLVFSI